MGAEVGQFLRGVAKTLEISCKQMGTIIYKHDLASLRKKQGFGRASRAQTPVSSL